MPIPRPTRSQLLELARAEIEAQLPGADARLRRSFLDLLARVLAAQTDGLYGLLQFILKQAFPDTAGAEFLARWGTIYSVPQLPADFATGNISVTGTSGITVPLGSQLRRANGVTYETTSEITLALGTAIIPVQAALPGSAGNAGAGVTLTFLSPVNEVDADATVDVGGITGGSDVESEDLYRQRILAAIRRPSGGGTIFDYERQAKLYGGVTDVFVHSQQFGDGTVGVAPLFYERADPIPDAGDISAIQALIDDDAFRPACATPTAYALTPVPVNFQASVTPNTAEVQAAIEVEIAAMFRRDATPGGVIRISRIREAFSVAGGETDHVLISPTADVDLGGNLSQLSTVGTFTWS